MGCYAQKQVLLMWRTKIDKDHKPNELKIAHREGNGWQTMFGRCTKDEGQYCTCIPSRMPAEHPWHNSHTQISR